MPIDLEHSKGRNPLAERAQPGTPVIVTDMIVDEATVFTSQTLSRPFKRNGLWMVLVSGSKGTYPLDQVWEMPRGSI